MTDFRSKGLGCLKQPEDKRDFQLSFPIRNLEELPRSITLRPLMGKVYDQKGIGSCVYNIVAKAIQYVLDVKLKYKWPHTPSRLFGYYNGRVLAGTVDSDSGSTIRDGVKTAAMQGYCPEDGNPNWSWPYIDDGKHFKQKPTDACYKDARLHVAVQYEAVPQTVEAFMSVLAQGFPILGGYQLHESFMSDKVAETGTVPKPGFWLSDPVIGGHALLIVGIDLDAKDKEVQFMNSWGEEWGDKGFGTFPLKYVMDRQESSDFWVIKAVQYVAKIPGEADQVGPAIA